jgi:hypothetical protein
MRLRPLRTLVALLLLPATALPATGAHSASAAPAPGGFPLRIVKVGGDPAEPLVRAHLDFALSVGFNAIWVPSSVAGLWTQEAAPGGPVLFPAFEGLARRCRERGVRLFVSVNPVADSGGRFRFSERDDVARVRAFYKLLERRAGVRDFVLSFDDQPRELSQASDLAYYGKEAALAHLDLARQVLKGQGRKGTVWLCAAVYCDWHLDDDEYEPYASTFLEELPHLPKKIGIVWTGPDVVSESITKADVERVRGRLGGRAILLYDNYPVNEDPRHEALALILGPLRKRGADLAEVVAGYLACPMAQLGASRLPLISVGDYLRDPSGYDPDASSKRAQHRLAGSDPAAREALSTQVLEWGGWVDTANYHDGPDANPRALAEKIDRPALVTTWGYTLRRYPSRMDGIRRIEDAVFRDDLLAAMERAYTVSRALPLVQRLRGVRASADPRPDAEVLAELRAVRESARANPNAAKALEIFLEAAGMVPQLATDASKTPPAPELAPAPKP